MAEPLDFSKTKRIVLIIDLHPLLSFQNPNANPYISAVIAAVKRLLNFTPLSNSLFAFKFFFSSLSPIRSASALHRLFPDPLLTSLSFNSFSQTLASLCKILSNFPIPLLATELCGGSASVLHTASSLLQLVHDYAWESEIDSSIDVKVIKQNSVFLFTRVGGNLGSFFNNMSLDGGNQDLDDSGGVLLKFCDAFVSVKDAFVIKDIHLSWIDVVCRSEDGQEEVTFDECGARLDSLVKGIRQLGWGFCSTDSIVLGSAILPFGLIYPIIGVSLNLLNSNVSCKRGSVQLSLGILDVNGNPLKCSCCDLELVNLTNLPRDVSQDLLIASEHKSHLAIGSYEGQAVSSHFLASTTKLCIKAVHKYTDGWKTLRCPYDIIMVQESYGDLKKHKEKPRNILFVDKALDMVSRELNGHSPAHTLPFWQIILSFLYKEGYWASVSLSTRNGDTVQGILKPFTAYSALLLVVKDDSLEPDDCKPSNLGKINNGDYYNCVDTSNIIGSVGSQGESTSGTCETLDGKKKKHRRTSVRDQTWSSFYKAATGSHEFDLGEVYFASGDGNKKLKFLKCWLKQVAKNNQSDQRTLYTPKDTNESSAFPSLTSEPSQVYEGAEPISGSETSESFFTALQRRIQHGLASGMDLQTLAERLVKSSIIWCSQAHVKSGGEEVQLQQARLDNSWRTSFMEVLRLLLKDPKEMKPSDSYTTSEMTIREYELQVLLRMELLQLDIIGSIAEPSKQKLEKQICALLEILQYLIDGGIHGNVSLFEYVERSIKTRYYDSLQDSVDSIYAQMDLLPFGDENETQALLFNSEDSSQSCKDTKEMPEKVEIQDKDQCLLAEDETQPQQKHINVSPEGLKNEERERKLNEARERRERSRRFVSYSSRMPDLQRVWAPKNPKPSKGRSDSFPKESKRKCRESGKFTVVSETPMTGMKRPSSTSSGKEGYAQKDPGNCSNSVSKALFLD